MKVSGFFGSGALKSGDYSGVERCGADGASVDENGAKFNEFGFQDTA
jgi:hypothetical protein